MKTSFEWYKHYQNNLADQVDWSQQSNLTTVQKETIVRSLQAWQKGETSDGAHLLRAAKKFAVKQNDLMYLEAVRLFIKEEQRHGEQLGTYLDRINEKRLGFDMGDFLFRKVRYFATSMELWTITVIIVESFAQLYYKALSDGTNCPLLKDICGQILRDEAHHIRFQYERLAQIIGGRNPLLKNITYTLYFMLFAIITPTIWLAGHAKVFQLAGINWRIYVSKAYKKFFGFMEKIEALSFQTPQGNTANHLLIESLREDLL